jgi:hypothetical protein
LELGWQRWGTIKSEVLFIHVSPIATEPKLQISSMKTKYLAAYHFAGKLITTFRAL